MTIEEIERSAMQAAHMNRPDPPHDLLDCFLYLAFYSLYATLYAGQLTREQAKPVKTRLLIQYTKQKAAYDFKRKRQDDSVALWKRTESAGNAYALERTLENADRLWAAVLNLPEGSKPKNAE